jgi:hypothetical protein
MKKSLINPSIFSKRQFKDNHIPQVQGQLKTIFAYLHEHIATASMVTDETGVPQKCITRYKRDLEKANMLWEIEKKPCKKTGFKAWYLTTDPAKAPKQTTQLNLF